MNKIIKRIIPKPIIHTTYYFLRALMRFPYWTYLIFRKYIPGYKRLPHFLQEGIAILMVFVTIFVGTGLIFLFNPWSVKKTEAAWFNDGWGYRKTIPITANTGVDTNTYISFTLDTATLITNSKLQSDCDDIRVTDATGNILQHHVGRTNACNNASTTIDALVPSLIASPTTFYVYYGNPSASTIDAGALSQAEASTYTLGSLGSETMGTSPTLYWKMDDMNYETAQDSSSNNLDGQVSPVNWCDIDGTGATSHGALDCNGNWATKRKITFNNSSSTENLTNFPVLLKLTGGVNIDYSKTKSAGEDLRFVDADGITLLKYEIEKWDETGGTAESIVWVKVPIIDALSSTDYIYMYYNNANADAVVDEANVWTNGYQSVWHLEESPAAGAPQFDDTVGTNNATAQSMVSGDGVTGKIGNAVNFDGTNNYISTTNNLQSANPNTLSISLWVKTGLASGKKIFGLEQDQTGIGSSNVDRSIYMMTTGKIGFSCFDGATNVVETTNTTYADNSWHFVAITLEEATHTMKITVDNSDTKTTSGFGSCNSYSNTAYWRWGNYKGGPPDAVAGYFTGVVDDVKLTTDVKSTEWQEAEYLSTNGSFTYTTYGSEITYSAGVAPPALKSNDLCVAKSCFYFDGVSNPSVAISDNAKLDFAETDNFTVSAWVKRNGASTANNYILTKASGATYTGYKVYMDSTGKICFDTRDGTNAADSVCSASEFDDDKWHFLTAFKTGTSRLDMYVDGLANGTADTSIASTGTLANSGTFYVGVDADGTSNEWLGFIDEVKIYRDNSARTAAQVKADYNAAGNPEGVSAVMGASPLNKNLSDGLVGYWKMDDGSGNATDSSGNSLTLTNNGTTTYSTGKFNYAPDMVPASSQYFHTATTISGVKSVAFWVYPDATTNYFFDLDGTNYASASSGTISTTGGGWSNAKIYVNGVQTTTITASSWQHVVITSDAAISASAFRIGRISTNYMDGKIDEARVYNRTLSGADVTQLYNFAPSPVGYWDFEEGTGATAYDKSGNGNDLTLTNSPTYNGGKYGSGLKFAGSNAHATLADASASEFDFGTGASFTLEGYFKHTGAITTAERIITKYDNTAGNGGIAVYLNASGSLTCGIDDDETSFPEDSVTSTAAIYGGGAWYHFSCVKDGTSSLRLYIDGVETGTADTSISSTGDFANADPLYIGIAEDATSNDWLGLLDEIKIYNYARTPKQIIESLNAGHPAPGSPVGSPTGYWKFDEGYGSITSSSGSQPNSNYFYKKGSFTKSNCTATCTQSVADVGFQPKALIFFWTRQTAEGFTTSNNQGRGFATSTTERGAISFVEEDACATSGVGSRHSGSKVIIILTIPCGGGTNPTVESEADLSSIDANGFTLSWSTNSTSRSDIIHYIALGGSDITSAKVGSFTANDTTGDQVITTVGFQSDFLMFIDSVGASYAADTSTTYFLEGFGFASGTTSRATIGVASQDFRSSNLNKCKQQRTDNVINNVGWSGDACFQQNLGDLTAISSTGFTINWSVNNATYTPVIYYLAIKGGNHKVGTITQPTSTGTQATTGLTFKPNGLLLASFATTAQTGIINGPNISYGAANSTSSRGGISGESIQVDPSDANIYTSTTDMLTLASAGAAVARADFFSFDSSGFTLNWTTADATAREVIYWASGPSANLFGYVTGPAWTNSGKFKKALDFDGTNDYVNTSDNSSLDVTDTGDLTISGWFNRDTETTDDVIVAKRNSLGTASDVGYIAYIDATSDKLVFEISDGTDEYSLTSSTAFTSTGWNHFAIVWDQDSAAESEMYINGKDDNATDAGTIANIGDASNSVQFYMGSESDGGSYFDGKLDEIKVFSSALTAGQAALDGNFASSQVLGSLSSGSSNTDSAFASSQEYCVPGGTESSCAAPVGRWDLDERTGNTAYDSSLNTNDLTWTNTPTSTRGKIGQAINLAGSNQHLVRTDDADFDFGTGSFTLEAFIKHSSTPGTREMIFSKYVSGDGEPGGYKMYMETDGDITCAIDDDGTSIPPGADDEVTSTAATYDDNLWHHVACVKNGSTSLSLYIDGVLVATDTSILATGTLSNVSNLFIGMETTGTTLDWIGQLDQIKIFNYARSAAQVAWDYNRGAPVGYWKMDECQGTTINNSAGNSAYNGTQAGTTAGTCTTSSTFWGGASGDSTTNSGKVNYAGTFDGTNDRITTSAFSPLATATVATTKLSWGGWYYPTSFAARKTLMEKATEFRLDTDTSGYAICDIYTGGAFTSYAPTTTALSLNSWNHVMCVYDGANVLTYINGVLKSTSASQTGSITAASSVLHIGQNSSSAQRYTGRIDEVKIFNYSLTSAQVKNLMNNGAVNFAPSSGAP